MRRTFVSRSICQWTPTTAVAYSTVRRYELQAPTRSCRAECWSGLGRGCGAAPFFALRPVDSVSVTASFIGYTNAPTGGSAALFAVTNHSTVAVRRLGFCWPEMRQDAHPRPRVGLGQDILLAPHESELLTISMPATNGVWRMVFLYSRDDMRSRITWGSGGLLESIVPQRLRGVPTERVVSGWIGE